MRSPGFKIRSSVACLLIGWAMFSTDGCKKKEEETPEAAVEVQAAHPTVEDVSEEIAADAILAPLSQAAIAPKVSAPIRAEYVQRGAHVRRGQMLVSLEDRDLRGSAQDSKGAVTQAQANYRATTETTIPEDVKKAVSDAAQLKVAFDVATRTASERRNLFQQGALSGRDADVAYAAASQAQAAYEAAQQHADLMLKTTSATTRDAAQGQLTSANGRLLSAAGAGGLCQPPQPYQWRGDGSSAVSRGDRLRRYAGDHGDGHVFAAGQAAPRTGFCAKAHGRARCEGDDCRDR